MIRAAGWGKGGDEEKERERERGGGGRREKRKSGAVHQIIRVIKFNIACTTYQSRVYCR